MPQLEWWAERQPDKTALHFPQTDERMTYGDLDARARRVAHWLIAQGLQTGDHIVVLMENRPAIFEIAWGAVRAGLYYTVASTHLKGPEMAYILDNSEAVLLITSTAMAGLAATACEQAGTSDIACFAVMDGQDSPFPDFETAVAACDAPQSLPKRPLGRDMLYSSGTTGLPKGVSVPLVPYADRETLMSEKPPLQVAFGFDENAVYLSPAPLYHAAPLRFSMLVLACGGTVIALRRFDAHDALSAIDTYRITHSQWVPTMFIRMLDLPERERSAYDVSSMRVAIHAAAPCPIHIKEQMIAWWGPVIWEYYAGSEGIGMTVIGSEAWLRHKGSVGPAAVGTLHILDDDGEQLPHGEVGMVYFANGPVFEYHNAPEKTRDVYRGDGMATYGDLGHMDEDGFLYLSDRRSDLIISGGVNIYPREIENVLQQHPGVADSAVIGVPDPEFGEAVRAFVQLHNEVVGSDTLGRELIDFCRERMSNIKVPKAVGFLPELPRYETGKLPRRLLKERYLNA